MLTVRNPQWRLGAVSVVIWMGSAVVYGGRGAWAWNAGVFMGPLAHWPQAINSQRAQSPSSRARRVLEPWPPPRITLLLLHIMSPTAILLFKWLQQEKKHGVKGEREREREEREREERREREREIMCVCVFVFSSELRSRLKEGFSQVIYWMSLLVSGYLEDRRVVDEQHLREEIERTRGCSCDMVIESNSGQA